MLNCKKHIQVTLVIAGLLLLGPASCSGQTQTFDPKTWSGSGCRKIEPSDFPPKALKISTHTDFAEAHFRKRIQQFRNSPLGCGDIVMLGDSLTELNDWSRVQSGNLNIRNRGISGDTTEGLLARLDELVASQPRAVFLLAGANDIWSTNTPAQTVSNILAVVSRFRAESPDTLIFVQTVFPSRWGDEPNAKVRTINALLKKHLKGAHVVLIDTHALLVDRRGELKAAYTEDGLHLNDAGNAVWSREVESALILSDLVPVPGKAD